MVVRIVVVGFPAGTFSSIDRDAPEYSRMLQNAPECSRLLQNAPDCSRMLSDRFGPDSEEVKRPDRWPTAST